MQMDRWTERNINGAGLQLFLDAEKAGASRFTIVVPSMEVARESLSQVNIELEPDVRGNFGVIAQTVDPDGNRITLAEPPPGM